MNQIVYNDNQNDIRLRGLSAFNPFAAFTSSSRIQMQSNNVGQAYVVSGSEPNAIQTGADIAYAPHNYNIIAEHNITKVIAVIPRYVPTSTNGIQFSPQRIVIYQTYDEDSMHPTYGMIDIPTYSKNHTKFGFRYKPTEKASEYIRVGAAIPKGTVLYDSPNKGPSGEYGNGIELNTVYMSTEDTIEDSIVISEEVIKRTRTYTYNNMTMSFGTNEFPLNLYGDDKHYKVMPDIGELCHPTGGAYNGLVAAKRRLDPTMLPVIFSENPIRRFDPFTDIPLDGGGRDARVIDIIVYRQNRTQKHVSSEVTSQLDKYADAYTTFCNNILQEYKRIMAETKGEARFTGEFNQLITHCMAITNAPDNYTNKTPSVQLVDRFGVKLDDYTVMITTEYYKEAGLGYKVTDENGGKGVISTIRKSEEMPFDPVTGKRADIIISPETSINRMNVGRVYEQTIKEAMVLLREWVMTQLGIGLDDVITTNTKQMIKKADKTILDICIKRIERFLEIMSKAHHDGYMKFTYDEKVEDIYHIIKDKMYLYRPLDTPNDLLTSLDILAKEGYSPEPNKLKFYSPYKGEWCETLTPVRIGPVYYWSLEKIGDTAAAVSTAKVQPNGTIAPLTSHHDSQIRHQATRFPAEAENRTITSGAPSGLAVEIHDQSNNPKAVNAILESIYRSDKPTDIETVIDRDKIPYGESKPLQLINHVMQCVGVQFQYKPFDESLQAYDAERDQMHTVSMDIEESNELSEDETGRRKNVDIQDSIVFGTDNTDNTDDVDDADDNLDEDEDTQVDD